LTVGPAAATGCLTLKSEHNDLAARVTKIDQSSGDRGAQLDEKLAEADRKLAELQAKLDQAETLLRGSQAGIGAHMDRVEEEVAQLRGAAENAELVSSSSQHSMQELRTEVDQRLSKLEEKLNEALLAPEQALRRLAPAFKRLEPGMERIFWQSRYGRAP